MNFLIFIRSAGLWVVLDRLSKIYINRVMAIGESVDVIPGFFAFTHINNAGASFGLFQNKQIIFLVVGILLIIAFTIYIIKGKTNKLESLFLGFIAGGAIGNMIDRATTGLVTDFIDFYGIWPYIFNVADIAVVVGAIGLVIYVLLTGEGKKTNE